MLDFMRKNKGSISIFLCLILLPMITYCSLIIDASRLQATRTQLQSAGDLTMNAAMSEYEKVLEDMYGLFAVADDPAKLEPALKNYFYQTISSQLNIEDPKGDEYVRQLANKAGNAAVTGDPDELYNFLSMELDAFMYENVPESRISNPKVMKSQIIDYMKYKGPVSIANNLLKKIGAMKDSANQANAAQKKIEYEEAKSDLNDPMEGAWVSIYTYNETGKFMQNHPYDTPAYDTPEGVHKLIDKMNPEIWTTAFNIKYRNNYVSCYKQVFGQEPRTSPASHIFEDIKSLNEYQDFLEHGNVDNLESYLDSIETYEDAQNVMTAIKNAINSNIVNIEDPETMAEFEKLYGDIEVKFDDDDPQEVLEVNFIDNKNTTSEYKLTLGNINKWKEEMSLADNYEKRYIIAVIGEKPYAIPYKEKANKNNLMIYYDHQIKHLQNIDELNNYYFRRAYFEKLHEMYNKAYEKYSRLKLGLLPDNKYLKDSKVLDMIEKSWINSETFKQYSHFMQYYVGTDKAYKENSPDNAVKEFQDYYAAVDVLRDTSSTAAGFLDLVLIKIIGNEEIKGLEELAKEWGDEINNIEDESVKSQMKSDRDTSIDDINAEDVKALRDHMQKLSEEAAKLMADIESVKFCDVQLCKENFNFDSQLSNIYLQDNGIRLKDPQNKGMEIANILYQDGMWTVGTLFRNYVYDSKNISQDQPSNNIKKMDFVDGKTIDGKDSKEEKFYNVLYNCYGNEPMGIEEDDEETNNAIDNINNMATVDENGNSTGTITESDDPKNKDARISGSGDVKESEKSAKPGTGGKSSEVTEAYNAIKAQDNTSTEEKVGNAQGSNIDKKKKDKDAYKGDAESGKSSLSAATQLLKKIADIGKTLGQDLYLEEYFTEMFTCQTDKKGKVGKEGGLKLINGYSNIPEVKGHYKPINQNNEWYGKEIEFILWGEDDLDSNLKNTEALIFLIRFAINAIYAFTAGDIQSFANSVATALVGWTVVLVPVVSVIITIGIALAESAYDLHLLKEGKDVVIIKDASTFVCSPTGALKTIGTEMTKKAVEYAANRIEEEIDKEIDQLAKDATKKISECTDQINNIVKKYSEQLAESIKTGIRDQFVTPLVNSVTPMINQMNSTLSNANDLVDEKIDAAWEVIKSNIGSMENGAVKDLTMQFLNDYGENLKNSIKSEIKGKLEKCFSVSEIKPNDIQKMINQKIVDLLKIDEVKDKINAKVNEMTKKMKDEILKHGKEAVTNLKNYIHEGITNTSKQVTQKITSTISENVTESIDKSASGGLTLNYKEYCKIFMFIKLAAGGEQNCLLRAAALIQANVRYAVEDKKNNLPGGNKSFDITQSYTIMYIGAKARVKTIFPWGLTINENDPTNAGNAEFDLYNMGDNSIVINYSGINSY